MPRTRISTTVDAVLLASARRARSELPDSALIDEALAALLAPRRKAEIDASYAAYDEHPLDAYVRLKGEAEAGNYPKPPDNYRWRWYGLFYVAPNQNSYRCRLRMPNGILAHWQFAGVADLAERYGGGYAHVTTRANLQVREIEAKHAVAMITDVIEDVFKATGYSAADIDWFVPHQANKRIIDDSAHRLGIDPAKVVTTVDKHGNTSAASIPLALQVAIADGRIKSGDLVLLEAMGGGFTWGAALVRW